MTFCPISEALSQSGLSFCICELRRSIDDHYYGVVETEEFQVNSHLSSSFAKTIRHQYITINGFDKILRDFDNTILHRFQMKTITCRCVK